MKRAKQYLGAFVLMAALVQTSHATARQTIEQVVATVNGHAIFLSEVRQRAMPFLPQLAQIPSAAEREEQQLRLYKEIISMMIDERLITEQAIALKIEIADREVDDAITRQASQLGASVEQYYASAAEAGLSRTALRKSMKNQLERFRLLNLKLAGRLNISEAQLRKRYEEEKAKGGSAKRFRASHIFFGFPEGASKEEKTRIQNEAETLREQLTGETLDQVREEKQLGGGNLGWLAEGDLAPEIEKEILTLDEGEISNSIVTDTGIHLFVVQERKQAEFPSFEEAKAQIRQIIAQEAMSSQQTTYIRGLRRNAEINRRELR